MTTRPIAFDLTRLVTRLRHPSPSGIDRVDLAYARHVLAGAGERFGLVSTGLGPRVLDRAQACRIVDAVAAGWIEDVAADADPVYRRLEARLTGRPAEAAPPPAAGRAGTLRRRRVQAETVLRALRAAPIAALPEGSLYLHTSHLRLDRPERFDWLYTRTDVRPVFFVHDLIPITHPEYGRPGEAERHRLRMRTIGRHAAALVVNSADTGARTLAHLAAEGFGRPPLAVGHLGVEPAFGRAGPRFAPGSADIPRLRHHRAAQEPPAAAPSLARARRALTARPPPASSSSGAAAGRRRTSSTCWSGAPRSEATWSRSPGSPPTASPR